LSNPIRNNFSADFENALPCVYDVMTKETISLNPHDSVADAVHLMLVRHVDYLLVIEAAGQIMGSVSYSDLLPMLERSQAKEVTDVMKCNPVTVSYNTHLSLALSTMLANGVDCLPVLADDGAFCGVLTSADLLKSCQAYLESEK